MGFVLKNFLVPLAFFAVFATLGSKPAIGIAVLITAIQSLVTYARGERISLFFAVASGFTVAFGSIDLFLASPRFFRLEPAFQNGLLGLVFGASVLIGKPIIMAFAKELPARWRPELDGSGQRYLRSVTWAWAVYFMMKAGLFLWLAFQVDLGRLVLLRSVIGGSTLALMLGGEIAVRRLWFDKSRRADSLAEAGPSEPSVSRKR